MAGMAAELRLFERLSGWGEEELDAWVSGQVVWAPDRVAESKVDLFQHAKEVRRIAGHAGEAQLRATVAAYADNLIPAARATIGHVWGISLFPRTSKSLQAIGRLNVGKVEALVAYGDTGGIGEWMVNAWIPSRGRQQVVDHVRGLAGVRAVELARYKSAPDAWHIFVGPEEVSGLLGDPQVAHAVRALTSRLVLQNYLHRRGNAPGFLGWETDQSGVFPVADADQPSQRARVLRWDRGRNRPGAPGQSQEQDQKILRELDMALTKEAMARHQECLHDLHRLISEVSAGKSGGDPSHLAFELGVLRGQVDAAWQVRTDGPVLVIEVKTLPAASENSQLRLGLGQVLDYAEQVRPLGYQARPILLTADAPRELDHWRAVCAKAHVELVTRAELPGFVVSVSAEVTS